MSERTGVWEISLPADPGAIDDARRTVRAHVTILDERVLGDEHVFFVEGRRQEDLEQAVVWSSFNVKYAVLLTWSERQDLAPDKVSRWRRWWRR